MMTRSAVLSLLVALCASALGCVEDGEPVRIGQACVEEGYLSDPYGTAPCARIRNICFEPANAQAEALAGGDEVLSLGDLFADESIRGVLLFGTAGWCQYCSQEAAWLNDFYETLQDIDGEGGRVEVVAVVFEDDYGNTATQEYAQGYAARKISSYPAVADTFRDVLGYFDASAAPGNIFINREDMVIQQVLQGFDLEALERAIGLLDGSSSCQ